MYGIFTCNSNPPNKIRKSQNNEASFWNPMNKQTNTTAWPLNMVEENDSSFSSLLLQIPCEVRCLGTPKNPLKKNYDCRRAPLEHKGFSFLVIYFSEHTDGTDPFQWEHSNIWSSWCLHAEDHQRHNRSPKPKWHLATHITHTFGEIPPVVQKQIKIHKKKPCKWRGYLSHIN